MWFSFHIALMVWDVYFEYYKHFAKAMNVEETKMMVVRTTQSPMLTREKIYNLCKGLNFLVSTCRRQINGVNVVILGFKLVRKVIICWRINVTKVKLMKEK